MVLSISLDALERFVDRCDHTTDQVYTTALAALAKRADQTPSDFALVLTWTCHQCGWAQNVEAPGFAGDGHWHYPDGETICGPITAQRAILDATPQRAADSNQDSIPKEGA